MFSWRKKVASSDPIMEAFKPYLGANPELVVKQWEKRRGKFQSGIIVVARMCGLNEILSHRDLGLLKNTIDNFYQHTARVISDSDGHLSEFLCDYAISVFFEDQPGAGNVGMNSALRAATELIKGWQQVVAGSAATKSLIAVAIDRKEFVYDIFGGKRRMSGQAIMGDLPKLLEVLDDIDSAGRVVIGNGLVEDLPKIMAATGIGFEPWKGRDWYASTRL